MACSLPFLLLNLLTLLHKKTILFLGALYSAHSLSFLLYTDFYTCLHDFFATHSLCVFFANFFFFFTRSLCNLSKCGLCLCLLKWLSIVCLLVTKSRGHSPSSSSEERRQNSVVVRDLGSQIRWPERFKYRLCCPLSV